MGVGKGMKKEFRDVFLNKYGYYELIEDARAEQRKEFFESEYYQNSMSVYEKNYTKEELEYLKNKLEQKEFILRKRLDKEKKNYTLLDIGCGEGFALSHFQESGFEVTGIDFSKAGVLQHNSHMADCIVVGDCEEILPAWKEEGRKFDVINIDSTLEVTVNPQKIVTLCREILEDDGVLLIKAANNYSPWQQHLLEEGKLADTYWLDKGGVDICRSLTRLDCFALWSIWGMSA